MKINFIFITLLYFLMGSFLYSDNSFVAKPSPEPTDDYSKGPRIFIPSAHFDFEDVPEGPDFTPSFRFYNKGKKILRVEYLPMSSEWGRPEGKIFWIKPGHYHLFKMVYQTVGHTGRVTKILNFSTNDPRNIEVRLNLDMSVLPAKK